MHGMHKSAVTSKITRGDNYEKVLNMYDVRSMYRWLSKDKQKNEKP